MSESESDTDKENNNLQMDDKSTIERKLRYRKLLDKIEGIDERGCKGQEVAKEIGDIIREVNKIEEKCNIAQRYQFPDETLLDATVLTNASSLLLKCLNSLDIYSTTYSGTSFAEQMKTELSLDGDDDNLESVMLNLQTFANKIIPEVPRYGYLYGAFDLNKLPEPKKKKAQVKNTKEQLQKKEPEKVTAINKKERDIEEIVNVLEQVLIDCYNRNRRTAISYYDYVIDTSSFSNTIDNIFYFSFLIRDGRAGIDLDDNNLPVIKPEKKKKLKEFRDQNGSNSQMITTISVPEWEKFSKEGFLQSYRKKNGFKFGNNSGPSTSKG